MGSLSSTDVSQWHAIREKLTSELNKLGLGTSSNNSFWERLHEWWTRK